MSSPTALHDRFRLNVVFNVTLRLLDRFDPIDAVLRAVKSGGGKIGQTRLEGADAEARIYQLQLFAADDDRMKAILDSISEIEGAQVVSKADAAMESHLGGACEMRSRTPIRSNTDLRIVYTPGVARVCKAIQADPSAARAYTNISNKVAIATNGTAILGLGDIGCLAGLPVMEGKSAIFWEFARISAEPVLIDTRDADEFIRVIERIAVGFGAIQIEDVAAPECFRVTRELDERLRIPVMHDDQHGTATVVLGGLFSALAKTNRKIGDLRCVISGAGAAGTAIADLLLHEGMADVVLCDRFGAIYRGRTERMNPAKQALAEKTNKDNFKGSLADAMKGRDFFIGVSQANIVSKAMAGSMNRDPIIFALANPVSEISQADALAAGCAVYADGRMMNNALAYPGIFRGALDAGAEMISVQMVTSAARRLAELAGPADLMPDMMDPATHNGVAEAVKKASLIKGDRLIR